MELAVALAVHRHNGRYESSGFNIAVGALIMTSLRRFCTNGAMHPNLCGNFAQPVHCGVEYAPDVTVGEVLTL